MHEFHDTFSLITNIALREQWHRGYTRTHDDNPSSKITQVNKNGYLAIAETVVDMTDDMV